MAGISKAEREERRKYKWDDFCRWSDSFNFSGYEVVESDLWACWCAAIDAARKKVKEKAAT